MLLISVSTGRSFLRMKDKLILWPIVSTEGFLAFDTRIFHTKFSDFCPLFPIFAVVFVSFINCNTI